ncbi:hypothetical protein FRC05_010635 [Tulasnella sp. 425]|nr:hypothetical protein FRC05_010635 [Tulasnella sp. 425]
MASNVEYYTPLNAEDDQDLQNDQDDSLQYPSHARLASSEGFFTRKRIYVLSALLVAFAMVTSLLMFGPSDPAGYVSDTMYSAFGKPHCPSHCPTDPFVKSGLMYYGQYPNDTRWVPFPHEPMDALQHPLNSETTISYDTTFPPEAFVSACPQYMKMMSEGSEDMSWTQEKTVLFIGSSHDRNNIEYFCQYLNGTYKSRGGHTAGFCRIPQYNFTLVNWFLFGMVDGDYDWFSTEAKPYNFEGRIQKFMLPMMKEENLGNPDLIIETSLFWDDSFFQKRARHYNITHQDSPFTYTELVWHRSRVHALIHYTRQLYGTKIPIMFRTRHFRHDNSWNHIWRVFQLDQSIRAIGEELGIKLFTWGGKLEGHTNEFYDGDQHFKKGPVTWLFGDMMLFYLKRAITPGCWQCHQWRD